MRDRLGELSAAGVAVWLDDLSRARLRTGELEHLRRTCHVVGVTTNPTILARALSDADGYAEQIRELSRVEAMPVDEVALRLITDDVRAACEVLRPVYDATAGVDGRVSIEVDPRLAHDPGATLAHARRLWREVDRPNLFIKIPATRAGLPAIAGALAEGISVNVTLIFSLTRYAEVIRAYLDGLARAKADGHDLATLASVASFFVSRVDSEVDRQLDKVGTDQALALRGRAALANAILAYRRFEQSLDSDRWRELAASGARPQRPLWASTSTKNPAYRDVMYVEGLIADRVVNTMPEPTIHAFANHGEVGRPIASEDYNEAIKVFDELAGIGVDFDEVTRTLEQEGVQLFESSWLSLLDSVRQQLAAAATTTR